MRNAQNQHQSFRPGCITAEKQDDLRLDNSTSYSCNFDVSQYHPDVFGQFDINKPSTIMSAVEKRQCEFFVGRYCAKKAMMLRGIFMEQVPIGINRAPVWPPGMVGAITHNDKVAISILGTKQHFLGLGVDIENWMSLSTANNIRSSVLNANEYHWLNKNLWPLNQTLTLLFSAKESFFKAAYPSVHKFFDFSAASIVDIDNLQNKFIIRLDQSLNSSFKKGAEFEGSYIILQRSVITFMSL